MNKTRICHCVAPYYNPNACDKCPAGEYIPDPVIGPTDTSPSLINVPYITTKDIILKPMNPGEIIYIPPEITTIKYITLDDFYEELAGQMLKGYKDE